MITRVYLCLHFFTDVYPCLLVLTYVYTFFTYVYLCLLVFTYLYTSLNMFNPFYLSLLISSYVKHWLLVPDYLCLAFFTRFHLCLH